MATFQKRGNTWRVAVCKKGVRASATFRTKAAASQWGAEKELEILSGKSIEISRKTFGDACDKYGREESPKKKGERWELIRLKLFHRYPLASVRMGEMVPLDLATWRDTRLTEICPSSVKREMNLISSILNVARKEWGWISENPMADVNKPGQSPSRSRRIPGGEIDNLLMALSYEDDYPIEKKTQLIGALFLLAIETAMRLGELVSIRSQNVNMEGRYVRLEGTKNGDKRDVSLSTTAIGLVKKILNSGVTISSSSASAMFAAATKRAGIEGLTFHDTRHEGLTRLAQKLEVLDLARMVGHRDPKSLMIYYNPTATEIADRLG